MEGRRRAGARLPASAACNRIPAGLPRGTYHREGSRGHQALTVAQVKGVSRPRRGISPTPRDTSGQAAPPKVLPGGRGTSAGSPIPGGASHTLAAPWTRLRVTRAFRIRCRGQAPTRSARGPAPETRRGNRLNSRPTSHDPRPTCVTPQRRGDKPCHSHVSHLVPRSTAHGPQFTRLPRRASRHLLSAPGTACPGAGRTRHGAAGQPSARTTRRTPGSAPGAIAQCTCTSGGRAARPRATQM